MDTNQQQELNSGAAACRALSREDLAAFLLTLGDDEQESCLSKRQEHRRSLRIPAELHMDIDGKRRKISLSTWDISTQGVGLTSRNSLPVDRSGQLALAMEEGWYWLAVQIIHSTPTIGGFRVGCKIIFD